MLLEVTIGFRRLQFEVGDWSDMLQMDPDLAERLTRNVDNNRAHKLQQPTFQLSEVVSIITSAIQFNI